DLGRAIVESPYLDVNPLNYRFSDTRGFSVVLTRAGVPRLERQFAAFVPFLRRVLQAEANAWYLNPLLVGAGASVERHCDLSLRSYTRPFNPPFPYRVDVLYVDVPADMQGGHLAWFGKNGVRLGSVQPSSNLLVTFDGRLAHEVEPVQESSGERVSLVLEQYRLPWYFRRRIPTYRIQSAVRFERFMEEAMGDDPLNAPADDPPSPCT
ncbi:MAG TPA: hypothetical protein VGO93_09775, partial [Candidatus Xenobia bacterium]